MLLFQIKVYDSVDSHPQNELEIDRADAQVVDIENEQLILPNVSDGDFVEVQLHHNKDDDDETDVSISYEIYGTI
jgi:hypothetical protein